MSFADLFSFFEEPAKTEEIGHVLEESFSDLHDRETGVVITAEFVRYFALFQNLKPLRMELHRAIIDSVRMAEKVSDLGELLQKSILMRLVEIYIENAGLGQKEKILNILSTSLETLAPGPLFLNLGLLIRPIFQQDTYQHTQQAQEEREIVYAVEYKCTSDTDLEIKQAIDKWIKSQRIDLDAQDKMKRALKEKFQEECGRRGVPARDDLLFQVQEMLNMQLTIASLQMSMGEEDLAPTPIH
jgi:hypothetical protein